MPQKEASFEAVALRDLDAMQVEDRDALPFGVVGFAADTIVEI